MYRYISFCCSELIFARTNVVSKVIKDNNNKDKKDNSNEHDKAERTIRENDTLMARLRKMRKPTMKSKK